MIVFGLQDAYDRLTLVSIKKVPKIFATEESAVEFLYTEEGKKFTGFCVVELELKLKVKGDKKRAILRRILKALHLL